MKPSPVLMFSNVGREDISDDTKNGHLKTTWNTDMTEKVWKLVASDRWLTLKMMEMEQDDSQESIRAILEKDLRKRNVFLNN